MVSPAVTWQDVHTGLSNLAAMCSRLGYDFVTVRAVGLDEVVLRLEDGRQAVLRLPAGTSLSTDALHEALRQAQ